MALRLTPAPAPAPRTLADRLAAEADVLLGRHDLRGWRACFDAIAGHPDADRRYEARRTLLQHGLAVATGTPAQIAERTLVVAGRAIATLEDAPAEPVLLNEAGVALYELGELGAAEALFRAALRLDPNLPRVARNLAEIARRREAGLTGTAGLPVDVRAGVAILAPRARAVADRARPAEGLTLSLCMIVKDEEAMLGRCLAAAAPWVDELIVVDTGSTDRTVAIAEGHGARVLHHAWTGDFSAARNVSFDAATSDWVLYLDADEVLVDGDGPRLRELLGRTWREALFLVETNHTGDLEDGTATTHDAMRLFRNRPTRRFAGRLHEQIQDVPAYLPERLEVTTVRLEHFGYLGEVRERKDKVTRNRELLERQFADGEDTPFLRFNLGMEHVAAGDVRAALPHLERAWTDLRADPDRGSYGFVPMLASHLVDALRADGRYGDAGDRAAEVLELFPAFTDVVLMEGQIARALGDDRRAEERYRRALAMGDAPSTYVATVGAGTFLAARALADLLVAEGHLLEAESLLAGTLRDHPGHLRTAESYAAVLLRLRVPAGEVVGRVEALAGPLPPGGRYLVAAALHRAGATTEAEAELRAVLAVRPGSDAARLELVETLVMQDRLADAATEALLVAPGAPREPAALRQAAFAAIADPDALAPGTVDAVLGRTYEVLPTAEHALLVAWAGGPDVPTPAAAGLAETMLNALARLERYEAFERLAAVFERTGLPWRERRERLARLYLRRGFLASAAEEWMAVVDREGPDREALEGLAIVADAMGMPEDAAVFAADAAAIAERGAAAGAPPRAEAVR